VLEAVVDASPNGILNKVSNRMDQRVPGAAVICLVLNAILISSGCGGSSSNSTTPPGKGIPTQIVVSSGDRQNGVPGETLPLPLDVEVQDSFALGVPNIPVTFALPGGQVFPSQVVTSETGHARALVRLPDTVFSTATITASTSSLHASFTATTGPRLLSTFGNVSAAHGAVRADGYYSGVSQSNDYYPGLGFDLFAPDGTLSARFGPQLGKLSAPGLYDNLWAAIATTNQNLYFRSFSSAQWDYVAGIDSSLGLIQFTDLSRSRGISSLSLSGPMAVDSSGNVYIAESGNGEGVYIFDATGNKINNFQVAKNLAGIAINAAGNLVILKPDPTKGYSFEEISPTGSLVKTPSTPAFSSTVSFAQDPSGNYLVLDNVGPLYVFDQDYNLLSTVTLTPTVFGNADARIAGEDSSGDFYISSNFGAGLLKYSPNGTLLSVTAWPVQLICSGCPSPGYIDQLVAPTEMVVDPITSDLYVADNGRSIQMTSAVLRFANQQFAQRLSLPQSYFASDVAIGSTREIYVADLANNNIHVFDMQGNELRTLQGSSVGIPYSIAIDLNDNKYVYDTSTYTIHVLDASDQPVTTLPLNLPGPATGYIRIGGDGTLLGTFWLNGSRLVEKLATDGTVLFSAAYPGTGFNADMTITDSTGNLFVAGQSQVNVLTPDGTALGHFDLGGSLAPACGITSESNTVYVCYLNRIIALSAN
jgi:hypothetical protein